MSLKLPEPYVELPLGQVTEPALREHAEKVQRNFEKIARESARQSGEVGGLTLNAVNWQNYASGSEAAAHIDASGRVQLEGLISSVAAYAFSSPSTLIIGTLSLGYRPAKPIIGICLQEDTSGNDALLRVDITLAGVIQIIGTPGNIAGAGANTGAAAYLTLCSMPSFRAVPV